MSKDKDNPTETDEEAPKGKKKLIIIIVAAVLETHIDRKAVATMKPSTMRFGLVPIAETIERAMRWWRFHFSIAIARVKPPMNKKMMSLP